MPPDDVPAHHTTIMYQTSYATISPAHCKLTFDLLTLKVVSESRVTWAASVPILVFLGISVLNLGPMYATDRQTSDANHRSMPST